MIVSKDTSRTLLGRPEVSLRSLSEERTLETLLNLDCSMDIQTIVSMQDEKSL